MISVGNDIVDVERIRNIYLNYSNRFLNRIFSQNEIDYCFSKNDPAVHLSGKFAAKEAVKKSILNKIDRVSLKDIVISNKENGSPIVIMNSKILPDSIIEISISHTDRYATAIAVSYSNK